MTTIIWIDRKLLTKSLKKIRLLFLKKQTRQISTFRMIFVTAESQIVSKSIATASDGARPVEANVIALIVTIAGVTQI